jgi:hypothetical protein
MYDDPNIYFTCLQLQRLQTNHHDDFSTQLLRRTRTDPLNIEYLTVTVITFITGIRHQPAPLIGMRRKQEAPCDRSPVILVLSQCASVRQRRSARHVLGSAPTGRRIQ